MTTLTTESTDLGCAYQRDGYVIHREPVLAPEPLARAVAGLLAVRDGRHDTGRPPCDSLWKPGGDPTRLCKIEQPQRASRALLEAISAPALGRLAAEAVGAREFVQAWWVQGLHKPGDADRLGPQVGWHQDLAYWPGWEEGSDLFTAWLALSEVDETSGPMLFVPGSHRWGLRPGGDFFGQDQEALRAALGGGEAWREVADCLPAGGISLHHRLTVHGSRANRSPRPRLSLAIHLRSERSQPKPGAWEAQFLDDPSTCPVIWRAG